MSNPHPSKRLARLVSDGVLWLRRNAARLEPFAYLLFASALTLWAAHGFFASLRFQLFLSESHSGFMSQTQPWSAPLDDVFIHFDFARATARGFPFQWSEGNGYSSGGTSLLYPFVLALGYRIGYEQDDLMLWAGMVAVTSVIVGLWQVRALAQRLPRFCSWLLPPALLSTGVLNWTLWSGMEVAFFFAIWALCARAFVALWSANPARGLRGPALALGVAGALLTATRPEAAVTVACLSLVALGAQLRRARPGRLLEALLLTAVPGALVVLGHALANRWFTGDWSAAGALAKLEANHPYLSAQQVLDAWKFHFEYQVLRVTNYHLSGAANGAGWAMWLLAFLALFDRRTRVPSILLWASSLTFMALVAFNGQVRWQNERYTMPALAWLLLNAGLGLGAGFGWLRDGAARLRVRPRALVGFGQGVPGLVAVGLALFFWVNQVDARAGQSWFFGRAARNIFDQHVSVGRQLRHSNPAPDRILIGDAGAIPYVSDLPALDIIGLGGYHDMPFARATRHGVAAALELVERIPSRERPDVMAIYPNWWGDLPLWFGQELFAFGVRGNVICGGSKKVVYRADWSPFVGSASPTTERREPVESEIDVGDLMSERLHQATTANAPGFVSMKILPYPGHPERDLWDAGRLLPSGARFGFTIRPGRVHEPLGLILRVAPAHDVDVSLWVNGQQIDTLNLSGKDGWQEPTLELPATQVDPELRGEIRVDRGELVLYHLWTVRRR